MNNNFIALILILLVTVSCTQSPDLNLISKQHIGLLTDSTQVKDLEMIFPNDSIVKFIGGDEFTGAINDIEVFDKNKNKILILTPKESLDSTSTIKTIKVVDERFKTKAGLNSKSTFKHIKDGYKISSIQNALRNIIVSVNEINAFFVIEKSELPAELRFDMNLQIDAIQIPDEAKIKGFYLQWF